jgi:spermidine synthase
MTAPLLLGRIQISVFLISAVLISYQILLVKMFSIQYWHHFAYLIISVALLGFGASGTFILLLKKKLIRYLSEVLFFSPLLLILLIWINLYLNRLIAFNPLLIIWQGYEILRLIYLILSLMIPFFLGAICIGITFSAMPLHINRIYFANLAGSGMGSFMVLLSFFHVAPYGIMFVMSIMLIGASLSVGVSSTKRGIAYILALVVILLYVFFLRHEPLIVSPFKDLAQAENLMGAKKEIEVFGPLGLTTVVDSSAYHYLPDMGLNCPYPIPRQKGLFVDGNTVGAIHQFSDRFNDLHFMDYRTNALAYKLLKDPDVFIIGGGSGTDILNAGYHKAKKITVVEMNRDIVHLMQGPFGEFSGNIYHPKISRVFTEDGRGFLQATAERFDLIQINLMESMGSASAGVYGVSENYLFTTEALMICLDRLRPGGILSVSRWMKNPPRDNIKLLAMAVEAIEKHGINDPARSMIMIRSWQTATLLVKNGAFHKEEIETVKTFSKSRIFDVCYYPGIKEGETNVFNKLEKDHLYLAAMKLLSPDRETFYTTYPFHVRPATDDSPFFSHSLKIDMLKQYLRSLDRNWIPFMDWSYILVWMVVFILFLFGMMFILIPIPFVLRNAQNLTATCVYFGALGLAYMFLEISIMQQFIRYLYDPVFSASVVIGSFLVYSGLGSLMAGKINRVEPKHLCLAICIIAVMGVIFLTSDRWLQDVLSGLSLWKRMVVCSLLIAPLAIPMGVPFPSGLGQLISDRQENIPWAWGINGFFSVMGSSATILIAIEWGFKTVVVLAVVLYILSAFVFLWLRHRSSDEMF